MNSSLFIRIPEPADDLAAVIKAESLLALAFYYRSKGRYDEALAVARLGISLDPPKNGCSVELQNNWGLKAEIATVGLYSSDETMRALGHDLSEELVLARDFPAPAQDIVWQISFITRATLLIWLHRFGSLGSPSRRLAGLFR